MAPTSSARVTSSREPVLLGEWLAPGTHVNAVGASLATARELDSAAVAKRAALRRPPRVDAQRRRRLPRAEARRAHRRRPHRRRDRRAARRSAAHQRAAIGATRSRVFKSLGLAIEDVAAARRIYDRAVATGAGSWIELGGLRDAHA